MAFGLTCPHTRIVPAKRSRLWKRAIFHNVPALGIAAGDADAHKPPFSRTPKLAGARRSDAPSQVHCSILTPRSSAKGQELPCRVTDGSGCFSPVSGPRGYTAGAVALGQYGS